MRVQRVRFVFVFALLLALLCLLGGCMPPASQETTYEVYFRAKGTDAVPEAALVSERCSLTEGEDPVQGLLDRLLAGPESEDLEPALPASVTLRQWTLHDGLLTVDFSGRYGSLSGIALTLADYSVVLTLTQLDTVNSVRITAAGDPLSYRNHQRLTSTDVCLEILGEGEE